MKPDFSITDEIQDELDRQDARWGEQNHPDGEDDPFRDPAGELSGYLSMHGANPFRGWGQCASGFPLRRPAAPTFLIDDAGSR